MERSLLRNGIGGFESRRGGSITKNDSMRVTGYSTCGIILSIVPQEFNLA
jgi:hypothetical protein